MLRKFTLAALALFATFGVLEAAAPASASINSCASGNICLYDANNFGLTGSGVWQWSVAYIYGLPNHCLDLGTSGYPNNMASSYADKSVANGGHSNYLYVSNSCEGLQRSYVPPLADANLADNLVLPVGMNNSISSIEVTS